MLTKAKKGQTNTKTKPTQINFSERAKTRSKHAKAKNRRRILRAFQKTNKKNQFFCYNLVTNSTLSWVTMPLVGTAWTLSYLFPGVRPTNGAPSPRVASCLTLLFLFLPRKHRRYTQKQTKNETQHIARIKMMKIVAYIF